MTELKQAMHAIEHGLLKVTRSRESPVNKMELIQRMEHHKVPGFSSPNAGSTNESWRMLKL